MIPSDFTDQLLEKVDIVDVIGDYLPLKKAGQNYLACCPFHKEKTPSFTVSPNKQFYHCFGCGVHGTAIGFVMAYSGLSFPESVEKLAQRVGMAMPERVFHQKPEEAAAKKAHKASLSSTLKLAAEYYEQAFQTSSVAQEYVKKRGLSTDVISRFGIGYAPNAWQALGVVFSDYPNEFLIESGMVIQKETSFYDRFRDRLMFPIRNVRGEVIAFGGRIFDKGEPKYLNSPETPVFSKSNTLYGLYEARKSIQDAGKILVVEGYMDVVALAQHGIDYAVATLGTATTAEHMKILCRQSRQIYFCFDGDRAGRKAAWRALEVSLGFLKDDNAVNFLFLPEGHDPDSYIRERGQAQFEAFIQKNSLPFSQYCFEGLKETLNTDTQEGKAELIRLASGLINGITSAPALKFLLTQGLARETGVELSDLLSLMGQATVAKKEKSYHRLEVKSPSFRQPKMRTLVEYLIGRLLINPQWAIYVAIPDYLLLSDEHACLVELADIMQNMEHPSSAHALEKLRGTQYEVYVDQSFSNVVKTVEDFSQPSDEDEDEFRQGMHKLNNEIKSRQITELTEKAVRESLSEEEESLLRSLLSRQL